MQSKIVALEKFMPEMAQLFKVRYGILQMILLKGPIGRRVLVQELGLSERTVRVEIDKLSEQGLVDICIKGVTITPLGEQVLTTLYRPYHLLDEMTRLEEEVAKCLGLQQAMVIKGDLDKDKEVAMSLGMTFGALIEEILKDNMTVAITGGTTIAKMIHNMPKITHHVQDVHVLPARGSVGERVELHASTLSVKLADKLDAKYETLTIPDNLSNQSIQFIKNEPQIKKILQKLHRTDMIIFGVGNAIKMAKHRKESQKLINFLNDQGAIAESFRHYFDADGNIVYQSEVIGVSPEMAQHIPYRVAVACGKEKAKAILAIKTLLKGSYLILDEEAAKEILHLEEKKV